MGKLFDHVREFFFPPEELSDDNFKLPLDDSSKLIRPMGTTKSVPHSFKTRGIKKQPAIDLHEVLPLDDESLALLAIANAARAKAYANYSGFQVGAALVGKSGQVYIGVNIENASYPAGICAERAAICAAVSAGETEFTAIAIAGGDEDDIEGKTPCCPCGICRQVLSEFCSPEFPVILADGVYLLGGLLPHAFSL